MKCFFIESKNENNNNNASECKLAFAIKCVPSLAEGMNRNKLHELVREVTIRSLEWDFQTYDPEGVFNTEWFSLREFDPFELEWVEDESTYGGKPYRREYTLSTTAWRCGIDE